MSGYTASVIHCDRCQTTESGEENETLAALRLRLRGKGWVSMKPTQQNPSLYSSVTDHCENCKGS